MNIDALKHIFTKKGYIWDNAINIIGVRNKATSKLTNKFDDKLYVAYKESGVWKLKEYVITTDAGSYYVKKKLINVKGVAILKEGQYLNTYSVRLHQNKYLALCQTYKNVVVYRDKDKDDEYDFVSEESGMFGINIHKAGKNSSSVENWSAGCQVFQREADFNDFMSIVQNYKKLKNNVYTYTLINTFDF